MNLPRGEYPCVKSAHTPARGRRVANFYLGVVDFILEPLPIYAERGARTARLCNFQNSVAGVEAVAYPQIADGNASGCQIFAQSAVKHGIAASGELIDDFGSDQEDGLIGTAVDSGMGMKVTFEAGIQDEASRDRVFRETSWRNVDLNDGALHKEARS
jgi:hypothetical protein